MYHLINLLNVNSNSKSFTISTIDSLKTHFLLLNIHGIYYKIFWNIAPMDLPRTSIVLCELTEDMEYEVKSWIRGKPKGLNHEYRILFFNAILPETIIISWLVAQDTSWFPSGPVRRRSQLTLVKKLHKHVRSLGKFTEVSYFNKKQIFILGYPCLL